jgi:thiol-disulfide isomerase/thioredoxin
MTMANRLLCTVLALSTLLTAQTKRTTPPASVAGQWDAVITNASKIDVPFILSIKQDRRAAGKLHAAVLNGSDAMPFTSATFNAGQLKLRFEQYDGEILAKLDGAGLKGEWTRQTSQGVRHYPFHATRHQPKPDKPTKWTGPELQGEWTFTFEGEGNDKVAPAQFQQSGAHQQGAAISAPAQGTVAPVSGDFGTLAGKIESAAGKTTVQLSRFDGIHILLLTAEFQPDGNLVGKLNTQAFTAVRKNAKASTPAAAEPDPESITTLKNPDEIFRFSARDPKSGATVTQDDPRFKGKPYIVDIFGTWCPNCHDEAPVLADIYKRYQAKGLEIVGLAYEYVDDAPRNARLLDIYRKKYDIAFPMLLAGTTDEGQIAKTLPQLQGFGAYPTTIFVGADGRVKKIHAGFAGPATGAKFTEVKQKFEDNVKHLVAK